MEMSFYTDVIKKDPRFNSTLIINDVSLLEPFTRNAVAAIIADAKLLGHDMMVFETYRSQARQTKLFNQKATELKTVGVHGFGLACDIVKVVHGNASWDGDFTFLIALAKKHGLISGNDWGKPNVKHSFIDPDHVQRVSVADQTKLFNGTWYPDDSYNPYV